MNTHFSAPFLIEIQKWISNVVHGLNIPLKIKGVFLLQGTHSGSVPAFVISGNAAW